MHEAKFPGKIDYVLLGLGAAALITGSSPNKSETKPTPTVEVRPTPRPTPTIAPATFAQRIRCKDIGAYNDKKLNLGCGQEKHQ